MLLVILDCDGTLWDHPDVSSMEPPFTRAGEDMLIDSRCEQLKLNPGVREFLKQAKRLGVALAVASWNDPGKVEAALRGLQLHAFFDIVVAEPHPFKDQMVREILSRIKADRVVYVDDWCEMLETVKGSFPYVKVIHYSVEVKDFYELKKQII